MEIEERLRAYFRDACRWGVVSAYLFGSHAAGRPHRESDVDVGVLLDAARHPERGGRFDVRVELGSDLVDALDHDEVDVVVLNDAPPSSAVGSSWRVEGFSSPTSWLSISGAEHLGD